MVLGGVALFHNRLATNITEKRSPRLDLDGISRRGFILQAAPDHDSPGKGLSAPETKRFL